MNRTRFDVDGLFGGYSTTNHCHTWVATGIAATTALYSGYSANQSAKAQAAQSLVSGQAAANEGALDKAMRYQEAANVLKEGQAQADSIRRQAMLQRGQILMSQSGSGTVIGEGSSQAAMDQLDQLATADALAALYSGASKAASLRASGRFAEQAGFNKNEAANQAASSQLAAGKTALYGSVLSAVGAGASGYVKSLPPAPASASAGTLRIGRTP